MALMEVSILVRGATNVLINSDFQITKEFDNV